MSVVNANNLSRRFGRRWAYARIDMRLEAGEKVLLIGANGSGKTTLLRTFSTLLSPSLGNLELFGQSVTAGRNLDAVRRRIGMLSHQTGLYEDLSILDNLKVFAKLFGRPTDESSLNTHIEAVGLDGRSEPIRTYSAGMRKRASVALLRLKDPELILLDEPFLPWIRLVLTRLQHCYKRFLPLKSWCLIKSNERHNCVIDAFCWKVD